MKLKHIIKKDKKIVSIFERELEEAFSLIETTNCPNTVRTFIRLIIYADDIRDSIFLLAKESNLYSLNILYRALLEHYVRAYYVYLRYSTEKNDNAGNDYIEFLDLNERINLAKAWRKQLNRIIQMNSAKTVNFDYMRIFRKENPSIEHYSEQELLKKGKDFQFSKLIEYINSHPMLSKFDWTIEFFFIYVKYSKLSSTVHGGPRAIDIMPEDVDEEMLFKESVNIAKKTAIIMNRIRFFSFDVFTDMDKNFESVKLTLQKEIQEHSLLNNAFLGCNAITISHEICREPTFSGTQVPVKHLFDYIVTGERLKEFLIAFPSVKREQAIEVLQTIDTIL
ncbi:DUF433 domain-containing protein [bacterium]|nr:DUF433 domain-containing protein [bacterium]